jgi:hypothetical protein
MTEPLDALLEQVNDPSIRASICAGWELGNGLEPTHITGKQTRKEIERGAELLSRKMDLDVDLVHGAALLSMSLTRSKRRVT